MTEYVTPLVAKTAAQLGVDLDMVKGTGVGGRIRKADVRVAAGLPPVASPPSVASSRPLARATTRGQVVEVASAFNANTTVKINPWALNPLLEDARQSTPVPFRMATRERPAPTVFVSGDLPVFLASGADPNLLLRLPWPARIAAASADQGGLAHLLEQYSDEADGWLMASFDLGDIDGVRDYVARMRAWLMGDPSRPTPDLAADWAAGSGNA